MVTVEEKPGSITIVDPDNVDNSIQIQTAYDSGQPTLSCGKGKAAYLDVDQSSVKTIDTYGNIDVIYEVQHELDQMGLTILDIKWSTDGTKVAFVDRFYERITDGYSDPTYRGHIVVVDTVMKERKTYPISIETNTCADCIFPGAFIGGSLAWLSDRVTLMGNLVQQPQPTFILNTVDGKKDFLPITSAIQRVSPFARYFNYYLRSHDSSACYGGGWKSDVWAMSSLLNLTSQLWAVKNDAAIKLRGVAADLNFEGYRLEYADVKVPNAWNLIQPASDVPVFSDLFTTWVPPYEGRFYVRLTVWDKAGNTSSQVRRVSWNSAASITNLYKSLDLFSPNGDGVKDTVELHYKVLEPVHLEFNIVDGNDNIVRTYLKDYASPVDDFITWDGRDESGEVVPDGKYRMKVFDYEFFVEVDDTPPDLGISLIEVKTDNALTAVELRGHAFDSNLKSWTVEYCDISNHQDWNQYLLGDQVLVQKDDQGKIIFGSDGKAADTFLDRKTDQGAFLFVGKLFRITAEDLAGNKVTYIGSPLSIEEKIYIDLWDHREIPASNSLAREYLNPFVHTLTIFETIQNPVTSINVQYASEFGDWINDASGITNPSDRVFDLEFNTSNLNPANIDKVRVKAVDELGKVYYSDEITFGQGGPPPPSSGNGLLIVEYPKAECNQLSGSAFVQSWLISQLVTHPWIPVSLDCYARNSQGLKLLQSFDLSGYKESYSPIVVDTSSLDEGTCELLTVLKYHTVGSDSVKEVSASGSLMADHTLPASRITYPSAGIKLCPIRVSDSDAWYGIPIEVEAVDSNGVDRVQLFYGDGENAVSWKPAATRRNGKSAALTASGNLQGQLGYWDITDLKAGEYSLKLEVTDKAGNTSCCQTSFFLDSLIEIVSLTRNRSLISPNADGILDDVTVGYQIDEYASVDLKVFALTKQPNGNYIIPAGSLPVRTIAQGISHLGGIEYTVWDGRSDAGLPVSDGFYAVAVIAKDSCGNENMKWITVEVDNTPPAAAITYPQASGALANIVEIRGTGDDLHFLNYTLEVGAGASPVAWTNITSGTVPVKDNVLGIWNTYGLAGDQTLRLTVRDAAGLQSTRTVTINLDQRQNLIKDLKALPVIFSPNNDGKLDTTVIKYELTDACGVKIEMVDSSAAVRRTYSTNTESGGTFTFVWNGRNDSGANVPDGTYSARLTANLASNPSVKQVESISITIDGTFPTVDLQQPKDSSYYKADVSIFGTISDKNLLEYSLAYSGNGTSVSIDGGSANRESYSFGALTDLAEGSYTLTARARDAAENSTRKDFTFTVDRTPPRVTLDTPKSGEFYGSGKNVVSITGGIVEKNLDTLTLRFGQGENPQAWSTLSGSSAVPADPQLFSWYIGKGSGVPDGVYTISLFAKDKVEQTGESKVTINIDNTPPTVSLTTPVSGEYVRTAREIRGTAFDTNLDKYTLEVSEGHCSDAYKWAALKSSSTSVQNGTILLWQALPPDGDYCLRLTAVDKVENKSEATVQIKVDTHPPTSPVLSGKVDNRTNAALTWTASPEPDTAGYNVYRGSQKINTAPVTVTSYLDRDLKEGSYKYTVTAVDRAGNESKPSNESTLRIDTSGPDAKIRSPQEGGRVSGLFDVKGTAYSFDDFKEFRISAGSGAAPSTWNLLAKSFVPTPYGVLVSWDTFILPDGVYSLKVEAEDLSGNVSTHQVTVTVDNSPPAAPVLLTATPNGSDVTLTWRANTEQDLAGYLLYRNEQPANASGIVTGSVQPYLISGTTYINRNLPDGNHKYYLVAVDRAGNMSDQSNVLEVDIDTHPPHATFTAPLDHAKFQGKTAVKAESPDLDITSVQFQFKKVQDSAWTDLGGPITKAPYATSFDPAALGIGYGDYNLKATATDKGGKVDPSPSVITVSVTDLTPPGAPVELKALTNGADVSLSWKANEEKDLDGYNIYRTSPEEGQVKVNQSIVREATRQDKGLGDGDYTYVVTAVDRYGNESGPSNTATAKIYTPVFDQPYTPERHKTISLTGANAGSGNIVEIFEDAQTGSGPVLQATASSDAEGKFVLQALNLALAENMITAAAKDGSGNISKPSEPVFVVFNEPPAAPIGLAASVQNYDVTLTWNPNTESDLAGYNLYRDGSKLNTAKSLTSGAASSSYYDDSNPPGSAFDGNSDSYWASPYGWWTFNPTWWELDLPSRELINHIEIHWGSGSSPGSPENLYAGKDFEIQAWSGHAWITVARLANNNSKDNSFDFGTPYGTDRIRIYITDTTDVDESRQVRLCEVKLLGEDLLKQTGYTDAGVHDGRHTYTVTAVDYYGFESEPSSDPTNTAEVPVGDVTAPAGPVNLTATPQGSNILLNWTANQEEDLAGYNVYRKTGNDWARVNGSVVSGAAYTDAGLVNGTYAYRVNAVDKAGNEGPPSNEAAATVYVEPPHAPMSLTVSSPGESGSLVASWQYGGSPVSGYTLRRSMTPGGPYAVVKSSINGTSYKDTGLTNGVTYYYVVSARDAVGNESIYSNEASGKPADHVAPAKPAINYPALPGLPVKIYSVTSDICGTAEPGSTVELFDGDTPLGNATALAQDATKTLAPADGEYFGTPSPSGRFLTYTQSGNSLWIRDIRTGKTVHAVDNVVWGDWASDLRRIFYHYWDADWNERIGIYDTLTGNHSALTDDEWVREASPSIPADGSRVAFISNRGGSPEVWMKDLASGSLTQVTSCGFASSAVISPDSKLLAYVESNALKLINPENMNVTDIDTDVFSDRYSIVWSPDSRKIAYLSSKNGNLDLFVYDTGSQAATPLTSTPGLYETFPSWSPDGKFIGFIRNGSSGSGSICVIPAQGQSEAVPIAQRVPNPNGLVWLQSGAISYFTNDELKIVSFKGSFALEDARLKPGENIITAVARDAYGNASDPSEDVSVTVAGGFVPDLTVTPDDIFIYPPYPTAGDQVKMFVTVRNTEQAAAGSFGVNVYLVSNGKADLLKSATIDSVAAGSSAYIDIDWDSTGKDGSYSVYAVVDPDDKIREMSEANNFAYREMIVMEQGGMGMTTRLDHDKYQARQDVNITVNVENSGEARDAALSVAVEDRIGNLTALLKPVAVSLTYGTNQNISFAWNTGSTFDGPYSVHSVLKDKSGAILFENYVPFVIKPDVKIDASINTDKTVYGSDETVSIGTGVANSGKNHIISELKARIRISNPSGQVVFSEDRQLTDIMPGALNNLNSTWQTGLSAPGIYSASLDIVADNEAIPSKTTTFTITSKVSVSGSISAVPASVIYGGSAALHYSVRNDGNADVSGLPLKVLIIDPGTGAVMNSGDLSADLRIGAVVEGDYVASTRGYALSTYRAVFQSAYQGVTRNLAETSFTLFDGTPPVVNIALPSPGTTVGSSAVLSVSASDDISGVVRVEYQIDGRGWKYLPLTDPSAGRYSTTWTPVKADEGIRSIGFRAVDKAGNTSQPVSVNINVDLSVASPVIVSPPNNSTAGANTVDIAGTAEPGATVTMTLAGVSATQPCGDNGRFTFPGVKLSPGWNRFTFTATDKVGNESTPTEYSLYFTAMACRIAVDKPTYNPLEKVVITSTLPNASSVDPIRNITARVSVLNSQGQTLFTEDKIIDQIDPLQSAKVVTNWNSATNPKGAYTARLQVLDGGGILNTATAALNILGTSETGEGLSGTIAASPASVPQGGAETINWSVRNDGNEDVPVLSIKVTVISNATQAVITEYSAQKSVLKGGSAVGLNDVSTSSLTPGVYKAVLSGATSSMPAAKNLAETSFEVKSSLQVSQAIPNVTNLLVWVDQKCRQASNDDRCDPDGDDACVRTDLLKNILAGSTTSYRIVYRKDDFQREMRNPYYTDYLIVGDYERLDDRAYDELAEQVYTGKGLILSGSMKHWSGTCSRDESPLGVRIFESVNNRPLRVDLVASPISGKMSLNATGRAFWVEAEPDATVAGWMSISWLKQDYATGDANVKCIQDLHPAIVLNKYGDGRTVFFAFDPFAMLTDKNFSVLSPIVANSVGYIHNKAIAGSYLPSLLVPTQVTLTSPYSAFNVRLQEFYPADLKIYDPIAGLWVKDNPWTRDIPVGAGASRTALSYALTPDKAGVYSLQTDAGYMDGSRFNPVDALVLDILVEKDRKTAIADIVTALNGLTVSGKKDRSALKSAQESVKKVKNRSGTAQTDVEKNIGDLMDAAQSLSSITSCDVKAARLMIDRLLISWEGQYYFRGAK